MAGREVFIAALVAQLPSLRRYALALVGNATLADDLVQDTIERALRKSEQLKDWHRLPGWLRRILHNLYIDEVRRPRRNDLDISEFADHLQLSVPAFDQTIVLDFMKALNTLSEEHRQILLLVGLQELSYQEVAEELDIPIGTVMSRLARARERLRGAIDENAKPRAALATFEGDK